MTRCQDLLQDEAMPNTSAKIVGQMLEILQNGTEANKPIPGEHMYSCVCICVCVSICMDGWMDSCLSFVIVAELDDLSCSDLFRGQDSTPPNH